MISKFLIFLKREYRPGQPDWDFWLYLAIPQCENLAISLALWFYMTSILADFRRSKTAVFTILEVLNFDFWKKVAIENVKSAHKHKIQSCSNGQNGSFWSFKMTKIVFTQNLSGRKILKFPHFVVPIRLPRSVLSKSEVQFFGQHHNIYVPKLSRRKVDIM